MKKALINIAILLLFFIVTMGLFFGPFNWYSANQIQWEYAEFVQDARKGKGVVYNKRSKYAYRTGQHYVSVRFSSPEKMVNLVSGIEVQPRMHSNLIEGETYPIYYKRNDEGVLQVRFEGENKVRNLGPIYMPGVGMVHTLFSYGVLLIFIVYRSKFKKKGNSGSGE